MQRRLLGVPTPHPGWLGSPRFRGSTCPEQRADRAPTSAARTLGPGAPQLPRHGVRFPPQLHGRLTLSEAAWGGAFRTAVPARSVPRGTTRIRERGGTEPSALRAVKVSCLANLGFRGAGRSERRCRRGPCHTASYRAAGPGAGHALFPAGLGPPFLRSRSVHPAWLRRRMRNALQTPSRACGVPGAAGPQPGPRLPPRAMARRVRLFMVRAACMDEGDLQKFQTCCRT